jgi:hypothetical protein
MRKIIIICLLLLIAFFLLKRCKREPAPVPVPKVDTAIAIKPAIKDHKNDSIIRAMVARFYPAIRNRKVGLRKFGISGVSVKAAIPMEYQCPVWGSNDTMYAWYGGSGMVANPLPNGETIISAYGGFNSVYAVSNVGRLYVSSAYNSGVQTWTRITTDTTGATISDALYVTACGGTYGFIRADGSFWYGGDDDAGRVLHPSGTVNLRPIQLSQAGLQFQKIAIGNVRSVGLTIDGKIYEVKAGGGTGAMVQRTFTGRAMDIAVGHFDAAACIVRNSSGDTTEGKIYWWGTGWGIPGFSSSSSATNPTDISSIWPGTNWKEVGISWNTMQAIDDAGRMLSSGYNVQGEVGTGVEFVNRYNYGTWHGYGWDFADFENPSAPPVQIGASITWAHLYKNPFFTFYTYAMDASGNLYSWGRGKTSVLGNGVGITADSNAAHPNYGDVLVPTLVTPLTATYRTYTYKQPTRGISVSSNGNSPFVKNSAMTLTYTGTPLYLINGTDTFGYRISTYNYTQISGPNTATITNGTAKTATISKLTTGTYIFQLLTTDANGGQDTSRVTIYATVNQLPRCTGCRMKFQ